MYSTCLYCQKPLGANQVVEEFPVGRRLAFDAARGRLWVVCRACERWNLSPIETRWEVIEACERLFAGTVRRVSTDNIGLARLPEGLELVRIGSPARPEFAAWRYGDQFGRRRRRAIMVGGGVAVAVGAVVIGASATGIGIGGFGGLWANLPNLINAARKVRLRTPAGEVLKVNVNTLQGVRFAMDRSAEEAVLTLKHKGKVRRYLGADAMQMAVSVLPAVNHSGGGKRAVADAVQHIEYCRGAEPFLATWVGAQPDIAGAKPLTKVPTPTRLALEMALHEEVERRAIEGELALLEVAWQQAEELAKIADDLLIPPEVEAHLTRLEAENANADPGRPDAS